MLQSKRLVTAALVTLTMLLALSVPASADDILHLELVSSARYPVPGDGSIWHELHPVFCTDRTQTGYDDNGNGEVDVCDYLWLDGIRFHIDWAGPTYHLQAQVGDSTAMAEPEGTEPGGNPTGEFWHLVYPPEKFCMEEEVTDWLDFDIDEMLSLGDRVFLNGTWWVIVDITVNIEVHEAGSPVTESTWSRIKAFFSRLIR